MDQFDVTPGGDPSPARQTSVRLSWLHPAGLLGLAIANAGLKILTLGLYNFWGKTEVRKRIWSAIRLDGEPLQYTGTGKELFLGFLMIFAVVVLPVMLVSTGAAYALGPESRAFKVYQFAIYGFFFVLTGLAIFRAQRYRLSRTTWRGIRGSLTGSDKTYAWTYVWTGALVPLTLGWIMPWRATKLMELLTNGTQFGNRLFRFDATAGPLYPRFAVLWIGTAAVVVAALGAITSLLPSGILETIATDEKPDMSALVTAAAIFYAVLSLAFLVYLLLSAFYRARQMNHFAEHTSFEGASFKSTATGPGLIRLAIGNFLLWVSGWAVGLAAFFGAMFLAGSISKVTPGIPVAHWALWGAALVLIASTSLFAPFIQARTMRYTVQNLAVTGTLLLDEIAQGADQGIRRGEGLAQAFDIDAF